MFLTFSGRFRAFSYRKINKYTKNVKQYKRERRRRKKVLELTRQGLQQPQIAQKLGVSVRTVQRDLKKLKRYVQGQFNKALREYKEEQRQAWQRQLEGVPLTEQFKVLTDMLAKSMEYEAKRLTERQMVFTVDMDNLSPEGLPLFTAHPGPGSWRFREKILLNFRCVKDGEIHRLGLLTLQLK